MHTIGGKDNECVADAVNAVNGFVAEAVKRVAWVCLCQLCVDGVNRYRLCSCFRYNGGIKPKERITSGALHDVVCERRCLMDIHNLVGVSQLTLF